MILKFVTIKHTPEKTSNMSKNWRSLNPFWCPF